MLVFVWIAFILFVLGMLAIDLGVLHRNAAEITPKGALRWTLGCMCLALAVNVVIFVLYTYNVGGLGLDPRYPAKASEAAAQYFTGWLVEQALSLDNVFLIAVIFQYFRIPLRYQHRVLFWGILGALVMRGIFIAAGAVIIQQFAWAHYFFGAIIIYAAYKMISLTDEEFIPDKSIAYKIIRKFVHTTPELHEEKFFIKRDGKWLATPLLLVLLLIEVTDVLFALDSIPAVFAITSDPFLVFASNIFAILNLRSMYFALALLMGKFRHLKYSLAVVLMFAGVKMMTAHYFPISSLVSLLVIVGLIAAGILASLIPPKKVAE